MKTTISPSWWEQESPRYLLAEAKHISICPPTTPGKVGYLQAWIHTKPIKLEAYDRYLRSAWMLNACPKQHILHWVEYPAGSSQTHPQPLAGTDGAVLWGFCREATALLTLPAWPKWQQTTPFGTAEESSDHSLPPNCKHPELLILPHATVLICCEMLCNIFSTF